MQLYAFDVNSQLIFSLRARKQTDYICPECRGIVRLRGGLHRQNHFYHVEATRACRQSGKTGQHLALQFYFLEKLPKGDCFLEYHLTDIGRIADVVWLSKKIVFEIQCSHMTAAEIEARNRDYNSVGFQVIWILHDALYNRRRLSAMECFLQGKPHYFSDIRGDGRGKIYDQFSIVKHAVRLSRLPSLSIDISELKFAEEEVGLSTRLTTINHRLRSWKGYFAGDLIDLALNGGLERQDYLSEAAALEVKYHSQGLRKRMRIFQILLHWILIRPYQIIFKNLLERYSKL